MSTVAVCSVSELADLGPEWDALESSLASPTQTLAWFQTAASVFAEDPATVFTVRDGGVVAAAPLASHLGYRETISVRRLFEPVDFVWKGLDDLGVLAEDLARRRLPLVLRRIPRDSPTISAVRSAYGRRALVVERGQSGLPFIELDETWRDPESHFNARRRTDLRRAHRRAEQGGDVDVEVLSPTVDELGGPLEEALVVEARSWKGHAGTALLDDPVRLPFYRLYAEAAARSGSLRIAFLRVGERPVAMQLAVEQANSVWLLKIAYDEAYSRASPGQLLMLEVVRRAAERGLQSIEFLGSSAPWTRIWTETERPTAIVGVFPARPGSIVPLLEHGLRGAVGAARRLRSRT